MGVTAALPAHLVSLLREAGLKETWVIAIPASMGVIQVVGRLLLYFFEHHFDIHVANRVIPSLIPLGLLALILGSGHSEAAPVFVLLFGLGNGMLTIVKGTAIAQYVSREHMASLNGALGIPLALARAGAPLLLGLLWSTESGYAGGLWLLLLASVLAVSALWLAQRQVLVPDG
jgi:MFS family permease